IGAIGLIGCVSLIGLSRWPGSAGLPGLLGSIPETFLLGSQLLRRCQLISAATARGAAVQALVARAVADHDRAAFGTARGVLLDLERDVRRAQRQGDDAGAVPIRLRRVPVGVAIGGHDRELVAGGGGGPARDDARGRDR